MDRGILDKDLLDRTPKPGEFYRHFKNKLYQVEGVATHSETKEKLVIYKALYGTFEIYARPLHMFVSEVDHVKYPEVTQKYRFEHVVILENGDIVSAEQDDRLANLLTKEVPVHDIQDEANKEQINPKLMEFLDAETFDEKYNVLVSMRDDITDKLIDDMAVVLDIVVPEGDLMKRYDDLKSTLRTRKQYEFANRLR